MTEAVLKTERLMLYPLNLKELLDIQAGHPFVQFRQYGVTQGLVTEPVLNAGEAKIVRMGLTRQSEHPWHTYWLMVLAEQGMGIGMAGFKGTPNAAGEAEIGYGIVPAYEGQGYTTEAVAVLVQWAFSDPRCRRIVAETLPENLGSMRVLEKNRFQPYGKRDGFLLWRLERSPEIHG